MFDAFLELLNEVSDLVLLQELLQVYLATRATFDYALFVSRSWRSPGARRAARRSATRARCSPAFAPLSAIARSAPRSLGQYSDLHPATPPPTQVASATVLSFEVLLRVWAAVTSSGGTIPYAQICGVDIYPSRCRRYRAGVPCHKKLLAFHVMRRLIIFEF